MEEYRISSNKRRGVYEIFHDLGAAFIRGWRLFNFKQPTVTLL